MESLVQVIEKAVEKQQASIDKQLKTLRNRAMALASDAARLATDLTVLIEGSEPAQSAPAKKPRAAIAVTDADKSTILHDLRGAPSPVALDEIVAPSCSNRRKAAALRQLAAEGKVQQVKGGKWQAVVAEKVEGNGPGA